MQFNTRVAGIPCICEVTTYYYDPGRTYGPPENCYPPEMDFEFILLDRKGYRAEWLERKLTETIESNLLEEYIKLRSDDYG